MSKTYKIIICQKTGTSCISDVTREFSFIKNQTFTNPEVVGKGNFGTAYDVGAGYIEKVLRDKTKPLELIKECYFFAGHMAVALI